MNILVTGSNGFIGKHLVTKLSSLGHIVYEYNRDNKLDDLDEYTKNCDFVYHLAGVNRPHKIEEFMEQHYGFTLILTNFLKKNSNKCTIMISSSIQATLDNPYGISKKASEDLLFEYEKTTGAKVLVYRLPNVFGAGCRPNYNSVIATFCHNIANMLPITVNDRNVNMSLVYIDDLIQELIKALNNKENRVGKFCNVPVTHSSTVGEIADLICSFENLSNEDELSTPLQWKLYKTYLSYEPKLKRILITGSQGFIGRNLIATLKSSKDMKCQIYEFNRDSTINELEEYTKNCDFVFHFAAVHRPKDVQEFNNINHLLFNNLLLMLEKNNNSCPILLTSSIHADNESEYGRSKIAAEEALKRHAQKINGKAIIYRLKNTFGKWATPNHHSVVATFCYNISRGLPIVIDNPQHEMQFYYIDDVINSFISDLKGNSSVSSDGICRLDEKYSYTITLGKLASLIYSYRNCRKTLNIPNMANLFEKKLYSTYLSYLPTDQFSYPLKMNVDNRGSFTEIIRTIDRGQFSVNIAKPGITKGNHWHHTKNEKFLVVSGKGLIRFRKIDTDEIIDYYVCGEKMEVVDIPTGYTHNIINVGDTDLVTFMWANETFDPEKPDTYQLEV